MELKRIPYKARRLTETEQVLLPGGQIFEVPKLYYPILPRDNFKNMQGRKHPFWVPTSVTDFRYITAEDALSEQTVFGNSPFNTDTGYPEKMIYLDMGPGPVQQEELSSLFCSPAPSAPSDLNELAHQLCERLDQILEKTNVDLVLYRDDWTDVAEYTEAFVTDTAAAAAAVQEGKTDLHHPAVEAARIFFEHAKNRGISVSLRCTGDYEKLIPLILDLKPDYLQLTGDLRYFFDYNDRFGDCIGFDCVLDGQTEQEAIDRMHYAVEQFASGGRMLVTVGLVSEEALWGGLQELHSYSMEKYGK